MMGSKPKGPSQRAERIIEIRVRLSQLRLIEAQGIWTRNLQTTKRELEDELQELKGGK
jgi:hypothetical protein